MSREVPEGWSTERLGDLVHIERAGLSTNEINNCETVKLYSLPAFDAGTSPQHISGTYIQSNKNLVPADCILFSKLNPRIPRIWRVRHDHKEPALGSTEFWPLTRRADNVDLDFLAKFLASSDFLNAPAITPSSSTNSHQRVDRKAFESFVFLLPSLREQRRIAEILSSVDDAIAATRAVIEQTRKVRTDVLAASFPTDLNVGPAAEADRFVGWIVEPASSICTSIVDCKNRTPPTTEQGYAVVRTPNVRDGRFRADALQFTDRGSFEEWTAKGLPGAGDILFTREAPYGEVCLAPEMEFCLGQRMMFLRPNLSRISSEFLLYALQSGAVKKEMFRRAGGSTVGHLRVGDVRELPIPVAPFPVQLRITAALKSLDRSLDDNEAALKGLEALKSALMSDLLTGRKRVTDALPMAAE